MKKFEARNSKNKYLNNKKGITLIALVITIIILLILAGIAILGLQNSGLFNKAKVANQATRYANAKELVIMKLTEIRVECTKNKIEYNLKQIEKYITENENTVKIQKCYYKTTASTENDSTVNKKLTAIVVSANEYEEYLFWIGETLKIEKIAIFENEKVLDAEDKFISIDKFENENLKKDNIGSAGSINGETELSGTILSDVAQIGQYVQYSCNNYDRWVIAGEDESGYIKLVSAGAPETYKLEGNNLEDAYNKLDNYCNTNYVDSKYAISAESYSSINNITSEITNNVVKYGLQSETSSELGQECLWWFFDCHKTYSSNPSVFKIEKGNSSYGDLGDTYLLRPVVYLRYQIRTNEGIGTSEEPYKLVANSGYEKNYNIELKEGQYINYTANNYSKWIVAGKNNDGNYKIVSVGAPETYKLEGNNLEDAYNKLDNYCNTNYVDSKYAISAESYSSINNITSEITNNVVKYGLQSETSSELGQECLWWFFDCHKTYSSNPSVFKMEKGNSSYGDLGDTYLLRPVVYLKSSIIVTDGKGTIDEPYTIDIK